MTLTEIRALPQELVEAFEKWHQEEHDFPFNAFRCGDDFEAWMIGARGDPLPEWLTTSHRGVANASGYAYWLGKRGGK